MPASVEGTTVKNANFVRIAGLAGMFGGALWLVALFIEYAYDLFQPASGPLYVPNQLMFFAAQLCYLTVIAGLIRAGAGGGRFGRISLGLFFFGWTALASALGLSLVTSGPVADALILPGAIASTLGGLLAGIAVAATGRLQGWPRLALLVQGLYQLFQFLFVIFIDDRGPTQLMESLWAGTWFLIGLALFVSVRESRRVATRDSKRPAEA